MATKPYTPSRPGMVQPESEQQVFDPEKMRKELKGMSPHVTEPVPPTPKPPTKKKAMGGSVKSYSKGGVTRADGCCVKGHTKGRKV